MIEPLFFGGFIIRSAFYTGHKLKERYMCMYKVLYTGKSKSVKEYTTSLFWTGTVQMKEELLRRDSERLGSGDSIFKNVLWFLLPVS